VSRVAVYSNGTFTKAWTLAQVTGSPVVGNGALYGMGGGTLYAFSGNNTILGSLAIGTVTRFATPALGPSKIYVGTTTGVVAVNVA
jgi:hypothetical protein